MKARLTIRTLAAGCAGIALMAAVRRFRYGAFPTRGASRAEWGRRFI